jgi:hypothetical protein
LAGASAWLLTMSVSRVFLFESTAASKAFENINVLRQCPLMIFQSAALGIGNLDEEQFQLVSLFHE